MLAIINNVISIENNTVKLKAESDTSVMIKVVLYENDFTSFLKDLCNHHKSDAIAIVGLSIVLSDENYECQSITFSNVD